MKSVVCPKCGTEIELDEGTFSALLSQVRDDAFKSEVEEKVRDASERVKLEELEKSRSKLAERDTRIEQLKFELKNAAAASELAVRSAKDGYEDEINKLKLALAAAESEKKAAVSAAKAERESEISALKLEATETEKRHALELQQKDESIAFYKDLKTRQSTKMIGETLEQHCQMTFDMFRAAAFPDAYFEKDSDIADGTKGDYIFRECDEDGNEYISIMFEMKNEMDDTEKKHKNEEFFKKLDSDRNKKKCEYAVLVSMLESDSEYYNQGIVDVSHRYPKMYVIRPQLFIPFITMLRNEARNSLGYRRELAEVRSQNLDVERFGEALGDFKDKFSRNCRLAFDQYNEAIEQINKSIAALEKTRDKLTSSMRNLRLANDKAEDLTVKKLCRNSPSLLASFDAIEIPESEE